MYKCKGCSTEFAVEHELYAHIVVDDNVKCKKKYSPKERDRLLKAHMDFRKSNKSKDKRYVKNSNKRIVNFFQNVYELSVNYSMSK